MDERVMDEGAAAFPRSQRPTPSRLAAAALVAAAVGAAVWLILRGGGTPGSTPATAAAPPAGRPVAATRSDLVRFAASLQQPIYWTGPVPGDTYEFTKTSAGNVYVRYLPKDVRVGDPRAAFRVVGTYPYPGALAALSALAGTKGVPLEGGGLALPTAGDPKSVHIAYPDVGYEIEVFDPVPGKARAIAVSGQVRPIR